MSTLPTTANRSAALARQERVPCTVLELAIDKCNNHYGTSPCTAAAGAGNECYNTYATCQDKIHYSKGSQLIRFASRNVQSPIGQTNIEYVKPGYVKPGYVKEIDSPLRPYLLSSVNAPTFLDLEAGLAARNLISVTLADESDNDSSQDPYFATRPKKAAGTYWSRWLARNKNYVGRPAKLRRGFVASPWDWMLFLDELFIIDSIAVDSSGQPVITMKDPFKLVDNSKTPVPTSGALQGALAAIENTGLATAGGASTITLAPEASPVDNYYNGFEVYVYFGTGTGQRRVVSSYVGATRVATLNSAWSVAPDATSAYQVSGLSINVGAGLGAQYPDPATSGKPEYIRIDSEIIRYTAKSGDTLSWTDSTCRAQFGSVRGDHSANASAQLCRAFVNQSIQAVITALLTENGIATGYISSSLADECAIWYGASFNITACISAPEQPTALLTDLLKQIGAVMWWSPQTQTIEFKAIMPSSSAPPVWTDDANLIQGGTSVKMLDTLRITQAAISYALKDATANLSEPKNYQRTDVVVDASAQSPLEYGDVRPVVTRSRWFTLANSTAMSASIMRLLNRLRDAPKLFTLKLDPKDYTQPIGSLAAVQSFRNADVTGAPKYEPCIVTQLLDKGTHIEVLARSSSFAQKYAFIAPPGTADYPTDTTYAHIANSAGKMGNGDDGYYII